MSHTTHVSGASHVSDHRAGLGEHPLMDSRGPPSSPSRSISCTNLCTDRVSARVCPTATLPLPAMSDPHEPPAVRRLDPAKMNRLAFIRLLYLQGIEQYRKPRPLSAASILTFHDSTELFLILAADHLQAGPVARDSGLLQYWTVLRPRRGFVGVELSGQHGIARLISVRNNFKHLGALPSAEDVDDARSSVTGFLEDDAPKVFGLEFSGIDMADVVPQEQGPGQSEGGCGSGIRRGQDRGDGPVGRGLR